MMVFASRRVGEVLALRWSDITLDVYSKSWWEERGMLSPDCCPEEGTLVREVIENVCGLQSHPKEV
jgi:integrase